MTTLTLLSNSIVSPSKEHFKQFSKKLKQLNTDHTKHEEVLINAWKDVLTNEVLRFDITAPKTDKDGFRIKDSPLDNIEFLTSVIEPKNSRNSSSKNRFSLNHVPKNGSMNGGLLTEREIIDEALMDFGNVISSSIQDILWDNTVENKKLVGSILPLMSQITLTNANGDEITKLLTISTNFQKSVLELVNISDQFKNQLITRNNDASVKRMQQDLRGILSIITHFESNATHATGLINRFNKNLTEFEQSTQIITDKIEAIGSMLQKMLDNQTDKTKIIIKDDIIGIDVDMQIKSAVDDALKILMPPK